jgi:hypothetical protein
MLVLDLQGNQSLPPAVREAIDQILQTQRPLAHLVVPSGGRVAHFRREDWGFTLPPDLERWLGPQGLTLHDAAQRQIVNMARDLYGPDVRIEEAPFSRFIGLKDVPVIPDVAVYGTAEGDICFEVQASYESGPSFEERDAIRTAAFNKVEWVFLDSALGPNAAGRRKLAAAGRSFWHGMPVPEEDDERLLKPKYDKIREALRFGALVPGQLALVEGWGPEDPPEGPLRFYRSPEIAALLDGLQRESTAGAQKAVQLDAHLSASYLPESVRAWNERQQQGVDWAAYGWPPPAAQARAASS